MGATEPVPDKPPLPKPGSAEDKQGRDNADGIRNQRFPGAGRPPRG